MPVMQKYGSLVLRSVGDRNPHSWGAGAKSIFCRGFVKVRPDYLGNLGVRVPVSASFRNISDRDTRRISSSDLFSHTWKLFGSWVSTHVCYRGDQGRDASYLSSLTSLSIRLTPSRSAIIASSISAMVYSSSLVCRVPS